MNIYERNLEALSRHYPEYAILFQNEPLNANLIELTHNEKGEPVIDYKSGTHSHRIEGYQHPDDWDDRVIELVEQLNNSGVILLLGLGMGLVAQRFYKKMTEKHFLVIYEAVPSLVQAACHVNLLTDLINSERVKFIIGENVDDFSFIVKYHQDIVKGNFWIVKQDDAVGINPRLYELFLERMKNERLRVDTNTKTLIEVGKVFCDTFLENAVSTIEASGVNALRNAFKGWPAIIISAGPSLEKNLHVIMRAKGKALIIAVDAALQTLLPAGILPDLCVGLDAFNDNTGMFVDNPLLSQVPFLVVPQYTPKVVNNYPGPLFVCATHANPVYDWLSSFWEDKGTISYFGGSVSHLAFSTAEYLGAEVIALVGQDLCFKEKFHAGEVTSLLAESTGDEIPDYKKGSTVTKDIFGDECYTLLTFIAYKQSFENYFSKFQGIVVNATEGGVRIEGAQVMRLSDFIDEYCKIHFDDAYQILMNCYRPPDQNNLEALLNEVITKGQRLSEIRVYSQRIVTYINRIRELKKNGKLKSREASQLIRKMEQLEKQVEDPVLKLVSIYRTTVKNYVANVPLCDDEIDVIEEPLYYYTEVIEGIEAFLKSTDLFARNLEKLIKADARIKESTLSEHDKFVGAGLIYREAGLIRKAVSALESAATTFSVELNEETFQKLYPTVKQIYLSLADLYLDQQRIYDAREIIRILKDIAARIVESPYASKSDYDQIKSLMSTCNDKILVWEERENKMKEIVTNAEIAYGDSLQSGLFYFKVKEYPRAIAAYKKAINQLKDDILHIHPSDQMSAVNCRILLTSAYYSIANVYSLMGNKEAATKAIEQSSFYSRDIQEHDQNTNHVRELKALIEELGSKLDKSEGVLAEA